MKKIIKYTTIIILSLTMIFGILIPTKADSGFDSSYDSGSSSSSGDNGSYSGSDKIYFLIVILFILFDIADYHYLKNPKEISAEKFNALINDMTMEEMRQKAYNIYEKIQYAWSNFDYDTLKKLTTDELYNMYLSQLQTLKIKAQQNVMKDITREEIKIINIKEENNIINFQAFVKVTCYDYIIDKKNNNVLRGTDKQKLELTYLIDYVKDKNSQTKITCPNCGGEQDIITSEKCKYCDSVLVQNASDYVMSKKTIINQRRL